MRCSAGAIGQTPEGELFTQAGGFAGDFAVPFVEPNHHGTASHLAVVIHLAGGFIQRGSGHLDFFEAAWASDGDEVGHVDWGVVCGVWVMVVGDGGGRGILGG